MLVKLIYGFVANNISHLKIKASVVKHIEYRYIYFNFSDDFKVEDIPDEVIINMLDNI